MTKVGPKKTAAGAQKAAKANTPEGVVWIPVAKLTPHPRNPRTIREDAVEKLRTSIASFPEMFPTRPVVVVDAGKGDGTFLILGGHQKTQAAKLEGWKEVPCLVRDWDEDRQVEFLVRDNVSAGDWDWDALANDFDEDFLRDLGMDGIPFPPDDEEGAEEIDAGTFEDQVVMTLKFTQDEHAKVRAALAKVSATPEQAIIKVLKL